MYILFVGPDLIVFCWRVVIMYLVSLIIGMMGVTYIIITADIIFSFRCVFMILFFIFYIDTGVVLKSLIYLQNKSTNIGTLYALFTGMT